MKKYIERVELNGAVRNEDFVVVSKLVMTDDLSFIPYEEGVAYSDETSISETYFSADLVEHVYDLGPKVDISLAVTLGLGVIKSAANGSLYLYNADSEDDEERLLDEMLRLGIYYQITNLDYDDRKLNYLLDTPGGEYYLRLLFLCDSDKPIKQLKEIFAGKKKSK